MSRPWREPPAMPPGLDPVAGPVVFGVDKATRVEALRRVFVAAMVAARKNGDHIVAAHAEIALDCLASNRPLDLLVDLGVSTRGGIGPSLAAETSARNAALRAAREAVPDWRDAPALHAAFAMIRSFKEYEARAWPRDRDNGVAPASQPRRTWFEILTRGWRMPGTAKHLAQQLHL